MGAGSGEGVVVFNGVVRSGVTEKLAFEQRLESNEGVNLTVIWGTLRWEWPGGAAGAGGRSGRQSGNRGQVVWAIVGSPAFSLRNVETREACTY